MLNQFKRLDMNELCEALCKNCNTLIIYHVRSDADAVGSAFALRELLWRMGIPTICACADEIPERLRFISEAVQGSVVIEDDMAIDFDRVISVDSASSSQLGSLFQRIRKDVDIMIDHHKMGTVYADYYIDAEASATGEIIYEIAKKLVADGKLSEIPNRVIQCVYAAISSDTGCFRFANVTPKTHRIAAELLEAGADAVDINHKLYSSKTPKQMRAEGEASRRLKVWNDGRIASVTFPYELKKALELADEHLETIIDIPRSVAGVEVAFSVRQPEDNRGFRVSMRSATDFDVSAVCALFGGGGHVRAAGCSVEASSVDEAEAIILNAITKRL